MVDISSPKKERVKKKSMIIGIDGNEANSERRVGIGAYAFSLLTHLTKNLDSETQLRIYLKDQPVKDMPQSKTIHYEIVGPKRLWTQIGLPLKLFRERRKPYVFFSPSHYSPRFSPVPTAISIMDLSFIHYPQTFAKKDLAQLTNWTKYSAKKAHVIFTISNASKNDIIDTYHVPEERVVVTYPGIREIVTLDPQIYSKAMLEKQYKIKEPYFLFVGTLQPRKNIERLIEAFAKLREQTDKDIQLVIVGKRGWLYEKILQSPQKYNVSEYVTFLDFVKDDDLTILYKHATSYVLPSLYEGFGLPVLEAMKYSCPVITSNVSSLPEAGGDAALYVNPEDVQDISKKMKMMLEDTKLRENMIKKGLEQVKKFSWDKTARQTLDALKKAV